jgi:hypothetical protein
LLIPLPGKGNQGIFCFSIDIIALRAKAGMLFVL